jgi:transposase
MDAAADAKALRHRSPIARPTGRARRKQQPHLKQIKQRLEDLLTRRKHLPRSLTGEALSYAQNQWDKLIAYLEDGRVQIDNNLVENAIRPSAIGKKNWLFMGDSTSGERAAIFYTLIGNCHRAKIDATAYLTDLFTRLPSETNQTIRQLTPRAWAQAQEPLRATRASSEE